MHTGLEFSCTCRIMDRHNTSGLKHILGLHSGFAWRCLSLLWEFWVSSSQCLDSPLTQMGISQDNIWNSVDSSRRKNAFHMLPNRAFFLTVSVIVIDDCWERWICKPENICSLEASFSKTYLYPYMSSQITRKNNYRSIYIILILWLVDYKSIPPWPCQGFGGCMLLFLQAERTAVLPKDGQCFLKKTTQNLPLNKTEGTMTSFVVHVHTWVIICRAISY